MEYGKKPCKEYIMSKSSLELIMAITKIECSYDDDERICLNFITCPRICLHGKRHKTTMGCFDKCDYEEAKACVRIDYLKGNTDEETNE
jgi:hypothetical protein